MTRMRWLMRALRAASLEINHDRLARRRQRVQQLCRSRSWRRRRCRASARRRRGSRSRAAAIGDPIFCWLPPESSRTGCSTEGVLIDSRCTRSRAVAAMRTWSSQTRPFTKRARLAITTLVSTSSPVARPKCLRSSER